VLPGVSLDDVEVYSTRYYNPSAHPGVEVGQTITGIAFPGMVEYGADGSVSMVFMLFDSVYTKGVKITLRQEGSDIVGQAQWAKYATGDFVGSDIDFSHPRWRSMNVSDEEVATNSYGVDQLTFVPRTDSGARTKVDAEALPEGISSLSVSGGVELSLKSGSLALNGNALPADVSVTDAGLVVEVGQAAVTAGSAFSGVRGDISFRCEEEYGEVAGFCHETNMLFTTVSTDCVIRNARLSCITNAVAWMSGSNLAPPVGYHVEGFFFENDGSTATCQFQMKGGNFIKCVLLEMKQAGDDIQICTPAARYLDYTKEAFSRYDQIGLYRFTSSNGSGPAGISDGPGYCITNLVLTGNASPYCVKLSGSVQSQSELHYSFAGSEKRRLVAEVLNGTAIPPKENVHVDVLAGANLRLGKAVASDGLYRIYPGGLLDNCANWSVNPLQSIYLEGGQVLFGGGGAVTYARRIVYKDGAVSSGTELRLGDKVSCYVSAFGSSPSFANTAFGLYSNVARTYTFRVDDVTHSPETDFTVSGRIYHCGAAADVHSTIVKTGAGTMRWDGACTAVGEPLQLQEGTLLLGASGVLAAEHRLVFSGGSLAAAPGTSTACRSFAFEKDAAVYLGEGASLEFGEIGSWDENAKLAISAGKNARLRIGARAVLTRAQLSRIRMNGVRVLQDAAGNVTKEVQTEYDGTVITVETQYVLTYIPIDICESSMQKIMEYFVVV
jgi:hypothetical protein